LRLPLTNRENGVVTRRPKWWWLQVPGWLLPAYLVYAQVISAFDYELGVRWMVIPGAEKPRKKGDELSDAPGHLRPFGRGEP